MTDEELNLVLAKNIAAGLIETGVEGGYGSVSCSTKMDYPAVGVSQWEGSRADSIFQQIGGEALQFVHVPYSTIRDTGRINLLSNILNSPRGQEVQFNQLAIDCRDYYVPSLRQIFTDSKCLVYAGMWCPTSLWVVTTFCKNRASWGYDINNLEELYNLFYNGYSRAAGVIEYDAGYKNRATSTYQWVLQRNLWG